MNSRINQDFESGSVKFSKKIIKRTQMIQIQSNLGPCAPLVTPCHPGTNLVAAPCPIMNAQLSPPQYSPNLQFGTQGVYYGPQSDGSLDAQNFQNRVQPIQYQSLGPCNIQNIEICPSQRFLNLSVATGYDIVQENGQRRMGPPPDYNGPRPPRGSEIFIGKIPKNVFEDTLFPLFSAVGTIYELRLMMNFSGFNRGFAFVQYMNPNDAWKAVEQLNDYEIRPGHRIGVSKSVDNCRLYIGNIPTDKTKEEAFHELNKYLQGITQIIMYPSRENRFNNRGFMFIEFYSHRAAAMAKRKMCPGTVVLWDKKVVIDWADPEPDIDPKVLQNVTKLFVRNLPPGVTDKYLRKIILSHVPASAIQRIYVNEDYAFLHFDTRLHAQMVKDFLTSFMIDGQPLEIQWARPRDYSQQLFDNQLSICRSLPPRLRQNSRKTLDSSSQNGSNVSNETC